MAAFSPIRRRPAALLLVLGAHVLALGGIATVAHTQPPPPPISPGIPTTPIQISGNQVFSWLERGERIFFLNGNGRIEQGETVLTVSRGIVWVNDQTRNLTNAYLLDVYGEDGVSLTKDGKRSDGPRGVAALNSRGEIKIGSGPGFGPPIQSNLANDPVFQRAVQERGRIGVLKANPETTSAVATFGDIQPVQGFDPNIPPPQPPQPPQPGPFPQANGPGGVLPPTVPTVPVDPRVPPPPGPPPFFGPPAAAPIVPAKTGTPRTVSVRPRTSAGIDGQRSFLPNGDAIWIVSQPVIINITDPAKKVGGVLDIEADRMVYWEKGDGEKGFERMRGPEGETSRHIEIYLAGHVELRSETKTEKQTLRCSQLYYDVERNVAIALESDLEIKQPKLPDAVHVRSAQLLQLNSKIFTADKAVISSSKLPSDPALTVYVSKAVIEEIEIPKKTIWGRQLYDKDGKPLVDKLHDVQGTNMFVNLEGVPVFYFPYLRGTLEDPLGPLKSVSFGYDGVFGFKAQFQFDAFELFGFDPQPGSHWHLLTDYYSMRGPALGTDYENGGKDLFGVPNTYTSKLRAWGIHDTGEDIIGGNRGNQAYMSPTNITPIVHPDWRGWFLYEGNVQDLPYGFTVQAKASLISDRNFLEQFHQNYFLNDLNQETFAYVKQQNDNWAWTLSANVKTMEWFTQTQWLPKADGYLLGEKLFGDLFTWNIHGTAGFAQFKPASVPPNPYFPTDINNTNGGVFNLATEVSLPFDLGPFRLVPYLVADGDYYSQAENGNALGNLYGGAGLRASIPFSRLYPDVRSDMFNLDEMYHKVTFASNYLYAQSTERQNRFPQVDRLNDDTTDQALRDIYYQQILINPSNAFFLTQSPLVNPQVYALRRLIDNRIDTFDRIDVLQLSLEQRLQTLRGFGASEHVVDWMSLNVGVSLFPQADRDNFGNTAGIFEYDWVWNIGDRTALVSNGWMEPNGAGLPRAFNFGGYLGRPDSTNFYLGYRQIDPLQSRSVVASLQYAFSDKYRLTASTTWDFGTDVQSYSVGVTRVGTDMQLTLLLNYNSITQTTGFQLEIIPNLLKQHGGTGAGFGR